MGFGSPLHWIIVVVVIVLLFGSGRVSNLMGDVAKGIKSFKRGMADDEDEGAAAERRRLTAEPTPAPRPAATEAAAAAPAEPVRAADPDSQA
jgi:sec-independent protein translocase protein TatA